MKISVITPNFNGARFLESCLRSVAEQRCDGLEIEHIVCDGGSTDGSLDILEAHRGDLTGVIRGPDDGPADAINTGLAEAGGEVLCWLNSDDVYCEGALRRVAEVMTQNPGAALCFGHCPIVDVEGHEIRLSITRFKEAFYPVSSRFVLQCVNYISQPAMFFRRSAWVGAGPLRTDLVAAWDYEFMLRLLHHGTAVRVGRPPMAKFRWTPDSISGRSFGQQFREEYEVAAADAGAWSLQALLHYCVRWGIVGVYSVMAHRRNSSGEQSERT